MPGMILLTHASSGEVLALNSERIEDLKDVSRYEEFENYWREDDPTEGVTGAGIFMLNTRQLWVRKHEDEIERRMDKLEEMVCNRMVPVTDAVSGESYRVDADSIEAVAPMTLWREFTGYPLPAGVDAETFIVEDLRSLEVIRESPAEFARRVNNWTDEELEDSGWT